MSNQRKKDSTISRSRNFSEVKKANVVMPCKGVRKSKIRGHSRGSDHGTMFNLFGTEEEEPKSSSLRCVNVEPNNMDRVRTMGAGGGRPTCTTADEEDEDDRGLLDAQKVDEWLKNRSDSLSSIELDSCEIKQDQVDDYEFEHGSDVGDDPVKMRTATEQLAELFMRTTAVATSTTRPSSPERDLPDHDRVPVRAVGSCRTIGTKHASRSILRQRNMMPPLSKITASGGNNGTCTNFDVEPSLNDLLLMTPQELERMPDSGIEFEQSVGPKELEFLCEPDDSGGGLPDPSVDEYVVTDSNNVVETGAMTIMNDEGATTEKQIVANNDSVSPTLATISISTDKLTNTTSIVINTKQGGQQSYKISTANLVQGASTLQPITIANLVEDSHVVDPAPLATAAPLAESAVKLAQNVKRKNAVGRMKSLLSVKTASLATTDHQICTHDGVKGTIPLPAAVVCIQDTIRNDGMASVVCNHAGRCKKMFACSQPGCNKVFNKQCKLKVHQKTHSDLRPYKCTVKNCDWSFESIYKLKRHIESHCPAKDFVCNEEGCNRRFTTIYNLKSHKRLHTESKSVHCPVDGCDLLFSTRRKMEVHLKVHQGVKAPYKCPEGGCDKAYYTTNSMASHLRSHQKTSFQCPVEGCGAVIDKMSRFKVHMWRHTGERPYTCTYEGCTWAFSSASKLNRHARKHTGERRYTCTEPSCGKSFMRLEHLQGHIVTHSGDKPYACHHKDCFARFTAKSSLYVHLKKHDGRAEQTVFLCPHPDCNKRYSCRSSLRIHMSRSHITPQETDSPRVENVTMLPSDILQDVTPIKTTQVRELPEGLSDTQKEIKITSAISASIASPEDDQHQVVPTDLASIDIPTVTASDGTESNVKEAAVSTTPHEEAAVLPPAQNLFQASKLYVDLLTTRVLQTNHSGSARTDYCSNYMLVDPARKRMQLAKDTLQNARAIRPLSDTTASALPAAIASDAQQSVVGDVLAYRDPLSAGVHFFYAPFLQEDLSTQDGNLYHEEEEDDGLLASNTGDFALPMMFTDPTKSTKGGGSRQHHHRMSPDFCASSSSTVPELKETTINFRDLE